MMMLLQKIGRLGVAGEIYQLKSLIKKYTILTRMVERLLTMDAIVIVLR